MPLPKILQERYQIERELGNRSDRQTLLALDLETKKLVTIKLLIFGGNMEWQTFKLFEREAKTLKELDYAAIPRYLDYFEVTTDYGRGFALVQSYLEAPSLAEHIQRGRTFSESELKQIATAVLEILIYLHNRHPSIIHRDLKPSNILLAERSGHSVGQVYLVDFGAVQAAVNEVGTRTVVGTYGYMPPEQFGGRAVPASDLYGLGATIIYLASGKHPADIPQKDLKLCFEDYVNLSPNFIDWLRSMTKPSLDGRLATAKSALAALENRTLQRSSGSKPSDLPVFKPFDTKVILNKNRNYLKIHLPPKGFTLELLPQFIVAIPFSFFLRNWYRGTTIIWSSAGLFMALFSLLPLGIAIWLIFPILYAFFGKSTLSIDRNTMAIKYEMFGFTYYHSRIFKVEQIIKLERTNKYYKKGSEGEKIEVKPQINIWVGTKKFAFARNGVISETELDWLAAELGEWLGLPVIRE